MWRLVYTCFEHVWWNLFVFLVIRYCEHWRVQYKLFVRVEYFLLYFLKPLASVDWFGPSLYGIKAAQMFKMSMSEEFSRNKIVTFPIRSRSVKAGHLKVGILDKSLDIDVNMTSSKIEDTYFSNKS